MMVVLELKYKLQTDQDRLDAIALLIAEAHGILVIPSSLFALLLTHSIECNKINSANEVSIPFYIVLCDGSTFQFLQFSTGRLLLALLPFLQAPCITMSHLAIPDMRTVKFSQFLGSIRKIVEVIFSVMLQGYKSAIVAHGSVQEPNTTNSYRAKLAKYAFDCALDAGKLHDMGDHEGAQEMAQKANQVIKNK